MSFVSLWAILAVVFAFADNLMKLRIKKSGLMCAMTFFASTGLASVISVSNNSFETLPAGGLPTACGPSCFYSDNDPIPGWTATGEFWGQFQPGTQDGNFTWFNSLSDGITIAFIGAAGNLSQTVGATVQTGATYTLLVDLGQHNSQPFAATADLLIDGVRYFAVGSAPPVGGWSTYTATYVGLPQDAGSPITIELNAAGSQGDFDNVRLSTDASASGVPEPNYCVLAGAAILAIGLRRRGCVNS
jgi:hypothetical protein